MNILEIVNYKSTTDTQSLLTMAKTMQAFVKAQPGFVRRELAQSGDTWTDLVWWTDLESAQNASESLMQQSFAGEFMAMVDAESVKMEHKELHQL